MTGFGSLYYTDCLPGQGLQGGAGFQFQAATPGTAAEAMHVVQRSALYEPPAAWMRDRRAVADYPLSLAHTAEEGFFATAAGRYLGQEANGTRQGNQFTHAVVTRDPADYGFVRPAQLWGADWWVGTPAADTTLDPTPPDPAPGHLDTETVRDRIRSAVDGEERLVGLLSAIQQLADPARRRTVVLVTADPECAACWLAAATLLLPRPQALRVSFKIFVTDPQYGRHDVVALHPEWAGRWADTRDETGLAVFDLDRGRWSPVGLTDAAAFWVPRFLRDDPYDVVDAVELAGQFAAARVREAAAARPESPPEPDAPVEVASPPEPTTADRLVAVVVAAGEPLRDPAAVEDVARWLLTAPEEAIPIAREPALEAVLATVPPAGVLRTLAAAVGNRQWEDAAVHRVLDGLLASELVEAKDAADGPTALRVAREHAPLYRPDRAGDDRTPGRSAVEAALRDAPPERFPALLTVAARHGVDPAVGRFAAAADAFARWWLERAPDELMPDRWDAPPEALDWVRDLLRDALRGPSADVAVAIVRKRWWQPLLDGARDPADELDALVWSSAYPTLDRDRAARLRRHVLDACCAQWSGHTAATAAWRITARFHSPGLRECRAFVDELDTRAVPLSPEVATELGRIVHADRSLTADGLWVLHAVHAQGHTLPAALDEQRRTDADVFAVATDLAATGPARGDRELAEAIAAIPPPFRELRRPVLADALLGPHPERAVAVLRALAPDTFVDLCDALMERWTRPSRPDRADRAAAAALLFMATATPRTAQQKDDFAVLRNHLARHVGTLGKDDRAAIYRTLPRSRRDGWTRWLREVEPSLLRRLGKVTGSFRSEPGKRED